MVMGGADASAIGANLIYKEGVHAVTSLRITYIVSVNVYLIMFALINYIGGCLYLFFFLYLR